MLPQMQIWTPIMNQFTVLVCLATHVTLIIAHSAELEVRVTYQVCCISRVHFPAIFIYRT